VRVFDSWDNRELIHRDFSPEKDGGGRNGGPHTRASRCRERAGTQAGVYNRQKGTSLLPQPGEGKTMLRFFVLLVGVFTVSPLFFPSVHAARCPEDSVQVGATCVDTHEASVWEIPNTTQNRGLINKVLKGRADVGDLTSATAVANGVVQRGLGATDDYPCSDNGNDCADIYAVSIPGVKPSANITWFQAQQACGNSGKELLSNAKWQQAAAGTPDPGTDDDAMDCNITNDGFPANDPVNTGSRSACVSRWGAHDMVGNVREWVEDWIQNNSDSDGGSTSTATFGSDGIFGVDEAFPETDRFPAALFRGGGFGDGTGAGVFALGAFNGPSLADVTIGFRYGR